MSDSIKATAKPLTNADVASLEPEIDAETGIDLSLMRCFHAMTVEERWQANGDARSFIEQLQNGLAKYHGQA